MDFGSKYIYYAKQEEMEEVEEEEIEAARTMGISNVAKAKADAKDLDTETCMIDLLDTAGQVRIQAELYNI